MSKIDALFKLGVGRRLPSDPFFADGDAVCRAYRREGVVDIDDEDLCHEIVAKFPCHVFGCNLEFDSLLQYELHYNSLHRYFCSECNKRLPSPHLLDLHISENHDSFFRAQAQRKPMYRCFVEECDGMFAAPQERRRHCIDAHQFPHDFRFDDARKQKTKHCKPKQSNDDLLDSVMEVDPSSGDGKCETKIRRPKSESKSVAMLPRSLKALNCGNVEECNEKSEEGNESGEATSSHQAQTGARTETFRKPLGFARGRGRYQRLGGKFMNFNSGINKRDQSSSGDSNVWGTSGLLDALQDSKAGTDDEKFACASDVEIEHG